MSEIYYIIGTAYAGKSTMIKLLSEKFNGILCEENYHNKLLKDLDKQKYPNLCYTRDLVDWHDFVSRTPSDYEKWIDNVSKECEELELMLLEKFKNCDKKIFVDTNISIETLKKISDKDHVLVMLSSQDTSVNRFFEREDKEKQFLYKLLLNFDDKEKAINNFKECIKRVNSKERYDKFLNSGFNVLIRDDNRSIEETFNIVCKMFKLM